MQIKILLVLHLSWRFCFDYLCSIFTSITDWELEFGSKQGANKERQRQFLNSIRRVIQFFRFIRINEYKFIFSREGPNKTYVRQTNSTCAYNCYKYFYRYILNLRVLYTSDSTCVQQMSKLRENWKKPKRSEIQIRSKS